MSRGGCPGAVGALVELLSGGCVLLRLLGVLGSHLLVLLGGDALALRLRLELTGLGDL